MSDEAAFDPDDDFEGDVDFSDVESEEDEEVVEIVFEESDALDGPPDDETDHSVDGAEAKK